jgi:hypothetical protein
MVNRASRALRPRVGRRRAELALWLALGALPAFAGSDVYRWTDAGGVVHLSSEKPPAGVKYERLRFGTTSSAKARSRSASTTATHLASASSAEQVAQRNAAVAELQNRECVVALEAKDRKARAVHATDTAELERLQQTIDRTCSRDPGRRDEQQQQAARLRVAKGDGCVEARNRLADMLEPGHKPTREQLKAQTEFIEAFCDPPVR